eukprot:4615788-Pyramimonas_sp.AAC.1
MELFSVLRVEPELSRFPSSPSLDSRTDLDSRGAFKCRRFWGVLKRDCPLMVLMSCPCAVFSQARATAHKMDPVERARAEQEALLCVSICAQVAECQIRRGRG